MSVQKGRLSITESLKKVLLQIANEGPQTKYRIEKYTKVNHASIHEAVKNLVNAGVLEGEHIGTTRIGLPKTQYKLTFYGLCIALAVAKREDYDKIIQKWKHLEPLLLGRWAHLKQKIGRKEAEDFIFHASSAVKEYSSPEKAMEDFTNTAMWRIIELDPEGPQPSFEKWIEAFKADPQLKRLAVRYIDEQLVCARANMKWFSSLKRRFSKRS
ncbi:MAG: hypothetical protein ACUVUF_08815 [Candidatus Bathycorpusculaceae bacterium]